MDRTDLWLPLLRRLTDEVPEWAVWKRADPAFSAPEDVDAVAPRRAWPVIERVFTQWAHEGDYPVVICRHVPDTTNLFALVEDRSLLQLEVKDRASFRGAVQFTAEALLPVSHLDDRGFRTLPPGAEAALKMTLHGLRRGGHPVPEALREHQVIEGLREDRRGAEAVAHASNMATGPLLRAIAAARVGGWDRTALRELELLAALRAIATPQIAAQRWWFRTVIRGRCPVLQTVYRDRRRIFGDVDQWLASAARAHPVSLPGEDLEAAKPVQREGRFVAIVGPDGVGKTTVARRLLEAHDGPKAYVYFRPPLRGELPSYPPDGPRPRGNKHPPAEPRVLGWLRLAKNLLWFWAGYLRTIRPVLRRGGLVVADRWGYGYVVQPGPLRFFGPPGLARRAVRLLPRPNLVANLSAPPVTVVARKDELTAAEVDRELRVWSGLNVPRLETFDASGPAEDTAAQIRRALWTQW